MNSPDIQTELRSPSQRLRYIREELLRITRPYIEKKYGLSEATLKAWETDKQSITEKGLQRYMQIYRNEGIVVSRNWILTGEGLDPKVSVNLAQYFREVKEQQHQGTLDDEILMLQEADHFKSLAPNSIIMIVSTEDMLPFYAPGDYVGGRFKYGDAIEEAIGKDCIIKTLSDNRYLRRLVKNSSGDGYNLTCLNPSWGGTLEPVMFDVDIECVAPIIWHRKLDK